MEKKKILICIDVQNDFITGALRNEEAIKKVPNIVEKINSFDGDAIFYTMDSHYENYLQTKEGQKLPFTHCVKRTEGWEIEPTVMTALENAKDRGISVLEIHKPTFGSFDLVHAVSAVGFDETNDLDIEFVGFCTDICVVSNALMVKAAFYDRADITVDAACCAGVTPETHVAALETMKKCQIDVTNMENLAIKLVPVE